MWMTLSENEGTGQGKGDRIVSGYITIGSASRPRMTSSTMFIKILRDVPRIIYSLLILRVLEYTKRRTGKRRKR